MVRKELAVLMVAAGFSGSFLATARAADSNGYSASQERAGTVEFSAGSENYDFRAEVGKPGAGKSVSQNFVLESLAPSQVTAPTPVPSQVPSSGSSNPVPPAGEEEQPGETVKIPESGMAPGGYPAPEAVTPAIPAKEQLDQHSPAEEAKISAQALIEELVSGTGVRLSWEPETRFPAVAAGVLSLPFALAFLHTLFNLFSGIKSLNDMWLLLLKLWYLPASLMSLKRKKKYSGTVYDSSTKQPIDPVIVELVDAATAKVVDQAITDMAGRYGFMAMPGSYTIRASKSHYQFPSKNVTSDHDSIFDHLYHGETIEIKGETRLVAPNIPMDPLAYDWNQQEKTRLVKFHPLRERVEVLLSRTLLWSGLAALGLVVMAQPTKLHFVFLAAYSLAVMLHYFLPHQRLWGRVYQNGTNVLMSGVLLELTPKNIHVVVAKARSSQDGKFFLKCMPGEYNLTVLRSADTAEVLKTVPVIVGEDGMFTQDLPV